MEASDMPVQVLSIFKNHVIIQIKQIKDQTVKKSEPQIIKKILLIFMILDFIVSAKSSKSK